MTREGSGGNQGGTDEAVARKRKRERGGVFVWIELHGSKHKLNTAAAVTWKTDKNVRNDSWLLRRRIKET